MRPFIEQMNVGQPYIASNGAQLLNPDHTVIHADLFTPEQARELIRYFEEKNVYVQCYRDDYFYFASENENSRRYARQTGMPGKAVNDLYAFVNFETPKVLVRRGAGSRGSAVSPDPEGFPGRFLHHQQALLSGSAAQGRQQGFGAETAWRILGFTPETTMAFGDSLNDLEMLRYTPHSVAMRNARDEVKQAARYVTDLPNTEDGLAHFVLTHVLSDTKGA